MPSFLCSDTEVESESTTLKSRKSNKKNKPLMERKRRARINRSLSQLKQILIEDKHKSTAQHSKWEKADILEMTVEYMEQLRGQYCPTSSSSPQNAPSLPATPPINEGAVEQHTPTSPLMNPIMQHYVAYQQLAQLSMYTQIFSYPSRVSFPLAPFDARVSIDHSKMTEQSEK